MRQMTGRCRPLSPNEKTMIKGSLVCKTSVLRTFNSCSTTTHHTPLIIHRSSHTTHHTLLIIHHSSYTTDHTPLIIHQSSYTSHHTPLIIHYSSYTAHTPALVSTAPALVSTAQAPGNSSSRCRCRGRCSTLCTSMCRFRGRHSTLRTSMCRFRPPCADFVAGKALCAPPCADFLAGAIQNALWRDSERTKCCIFQWNRWLRSWQVKVCGTTGARRSRVILGSFSGMVGIVPPLGLEFSLVS